jgi:hypothetical protein
MRYPKQQVCRGAERLILRAICHTGGDCAVSDSRTECIVAGVRTVLDDGVSRARRSVEVLG